MRYALVIVFSLLILMCELFCRLVYFGGFWSCQLLVSLVGFGFLIPGFWPFL